MVARLNHTIVWCKDKHKSSRFMAEILSLPEPRTFGPFEIVDAGNDVSLDFHEMGGPIPPQHYAFLVSDEEFDAGMARIRDKGLTFWADPEGKREGEINNNDGGRGVYFRDPDGHYLEMITTPYGVPKP